MVCPENADRSAWNAVIDATTSGDAPVVLNGVARLVVSNTTLGSDFTMAASATMRNEN